MLFGSHQEKIVVYFGFDGLSYGSRKTPTAMPDVIQGKSHVTVIPVDTPKSLSVPPQQAADSILQSIKAKMERMPRFKPSKIQFLIHGHGTPQETILTNHLGKSFDTTALAPIINILHRNLKTDKGIPSLEATELKFIVCNAMLSRLNKTAMQNGEEEIDSFLPYLRKKVYISGANSELLYSEQNGSIASSVVQKLNFAPDKIKGVYGEGRISTQFLPRVFSGQRILDNKISGRGNDDVKLIFKPSDQFKKKWEGREADKIVPKLA